MSLNLLIDPGTVSVVVTVPLDRVEHYHNWHRIYTNRDLVRATGFGRGANIALRSANSNYAIEWLEIGDHTTAHHLHDVDQRISMMQRYIDTQQDTFEFSVDWARSYINWDIYAR
jgi:rRNA processing protein Krr1/Pno1